MMITFGISLSPTTLETHAWDRKKFSIDDSVCHWKTLITIVIISLLRHSEIRYVTVPSRTQAPTDKTQPFLGHSRPMRGLYWSPGDQSEASICCMFVSVRVTLGCEMFHPWSDWPQCARPGPGPTVLALYYPGGEGRGHTTESDIHILQHTSYQAWPGPGPNEWCNYYFSLLG